jgi:HEAT repeat protein
MKNFTKILIALLFLSIIAFWVYLKIIITPERIAWNTISQLLTDNDPEIRAEVSLAIGRCSSETSVPPIKKAIPLLEKALNDKDKDVRKCAVIALAKIHTTESFALLHSKGLRDPNIGVRLYSAIPLLNINDERAFITLRYILNDSIFGLTAATALAKYGDSLSITILQDKLEKGDIIEKISAGKALMNIKYQISNIKYQNLIEQGIKQSDKEVKLQAIETASLNSHLPKATLALLTLNLLIELATEDEDPEIRQKAIEALTRTSHLAPRTSILPLLKQAFKDESDVVRVGVCKALGKIRNPNDEIRNILIDALQDSSNFVRLEASESLVKLGEKRGLYVLNSALKIGDKWERRRAAEALSRVGIPASIKILQMCLNEEDKKCKIYIAEAMIKILIKSKIKY